MVGIDTGEPTDGFYDHVRELPDVRADLGNAHLQAAAVAAELVITLDTRQEARRPRPGQARARQLGLIS